MLVKKQMVADEELINEGQHIVPHSDLSNQHSHFMDGNVVLRQSYQTFSSSVELLDIN